MGQCKMTSSTRMNLMLCMGAMVISLVPGQRITSNSKVGASDTKFFLPTSGSSPDLLSGAAGFGLGLAASQIGGNLINSLGYWRREQLCVWEEEAPGQWEGYQTIWPWRKH